MFGSPWPDRLASAVFALVAVLSLARLAVSWRDAGQGGRAGAAAHATMAAGMAAMAVPAADPLPRWGWLIAFGVVAAWFAVLPGAGDTAAVLPAPLAWLLGAGFLVLAAWWTVDLLRGIGRSSAVDTPSGLAAVRAALTAPALASGCTIVMAVGMGAMALMLG